MDYENVFIIHNIIVLQSGHPAALEVGPIFIDYLKGFFLFPLLL